MTPPSFDVLRVEPDGSTVIAGRAAPHSKLEITDGAAIVAKVDVGPSGDFAAVLDKPLPPGDHQLVLKATGKDGKATVSEETATVSVPTDKNGKLLAMVTKPGKASRIIAAPTPDAANLPAVAAPQTAAASPATTPAPALAAPRPHRLPKRRLPPCPHCHPARPSLRLQHQACRSRRPPPRGRHPLRLNCALPPSKSKATRFSSPAPQKPAPRCAARPTAGRSAPRRRARTAVS